MLSVGLRLQEAKNLVGWTSQPLLDTY